PLFSGGHAQTLAAYAWPRRFRYQPVSDEERLFEVAADSKVLAHCRWQPDTVGHPTIVLWHGIEGSSSSVYMLAMAEKAFRAGFNVLRLNLRNCGGTERLTPTLYHGGLTEDLRAVVGELIERDRLAQIFLVGFSLGGNMVLKLAGEYGNSPPKEIVGVCAVSPSVDLNASADCIEMRSNRLYHWDFLRRLKKRILNKHKMLPEVYDVSGLERIRRLRDFDNRFTAIVHGFENSADYYYRASALRVIAQITIPTVIIHARDDPFIPFAPLLDSAVTENLNILLHATERGGHVAVISERPFADEPDRFWAENQVVTFCRLASETGGEF
ncbi:MAG: YheT family hydrolase, partial [Pyrinomonadaceae bacterium]